jgi:transposase
VQVTEYQGHARKCRNCGPVTWAKIPNDIRAHVAVGLAALLGKKIKGVISSDRCSVSGQLKVGLRQLCWAHLKRDFQKLVDRGGVAKDYGQRGLAAVPILFHEWRLFRGGGSRAALRRELEPLREALRSWLEEGGRGADAKTPALCDNLLSVAPVLWTFLYKSGVEPTNNRVVAQ